MSHTPGWTSPGNEPRREVPPGPPEAAPGGSPAGPQPGPWGTLPRYPTAGDLRPGIVPLRPLGLGEIYDGAFQAVRSNPSAMVGASAVVVTVMTAAQLVIQSWMFGSLGTLLEALAGGPGAVDVESVASAAGSIGAASAVTQVVTIIALSVLTGLATVVVGNAVLGRPTAGSELWRRVRSRLLALIVLTLLVSLLVALAAAAALLPGVLLLLVSPVAGVLVLLLGVLAAVAVALWLDTRWAMAGPALLLEEQPILRAMRRAWQLTSSGFWRVLGIRLLTFLVVLTAVTVVGTPFALVANALFGPDPNPADPFAVQQTLPQLLVTGVGSAIAATIVYPFAAAVTALLYVDQRIRLEGLDVELARAAVERP